MIKKPKYTLKEFYTLFEEAVRTTKFILRPHGALRAEETPVGCVGTLYCPLAVTFKDIHWNRVYSSGLLSKTSFETILDASDNRGHLGTRTRLARRRLLQIALPKERV